MVHVFNKIIKNIFSNFIAHETAIKNSMIKNIIKNKNSPYKNQLEKNKNNESLTTFKLFRNR